MRTLGIIFAQLFDTMHELEDLGGGGSTTVTFWDFVQSVFYSALASYGLIIGVFTLLLIMQLMRIYTTKGFKIIRRAFKSSPLAREK